MFSKSLSLFSRRAPEGVLWANQAAAAATEAESLTWQRVDVALAGATPGAQTIFRAFKTFMAGTKACPDLRYTSLINSTVSPNLATASTGGLYGLITTARLYAVYIRKTTTASTTAAYLKLFDDGTDSAISGLTAASRLVIPLGAVSSGAPGTLLEGLYISPNGFPLANGIRFSLVTLADTFTISSTTDGGDGFCITAP